ncbi:MAG: AraC family ligand binding domain-containing protein [Clostridiales bacterium]|nr:AraC family ligand binding domain-containing protein [Clostridiales bacterium]
MEAVFARGTQTTDFFSDNFFYVNNCGYYNNIDIGFQVSRTDGRQDYQFIFISQGCMEVLSNGVFIPVHAGGAVLFRPGEPQCYHISESSGTSYYWLHFSGFYAEEILNQADIVENIFYSKCLSDLKPLFRELVGAIRSGGSDLFAAGLAISLLSSVSVKPQSMFARIIDQMNNDIDCGIFDRDYAQSAHMSKYHFIRSFSGACGKTATRIFLVAENGACKAAAFRYLRENRRNSRTAWL